RPEAAGGDLMHSDARVEVAGVAEEVGVVGDEPGGLPAEVAGDVADAARGAADDLVLELDERVVGGVGNHAAAARPGARDDGARPAPGAERCGAVPEGRYEEPVGVEARAGAAVHAMTRGDDQARLHGRRRAHEVAAARDREEELPDGP